MRRRYFLIYLLFPLLFSCTGCSFISISLFPAVEPLKETTISGKGKNKILIIDISGIISEDREGSIISLTEEPRMLARIKEELEKAIKDKNIKAVILRINSPGGKVTASDTIYHEVQEFKKKKKVPVIAWIEGLGTSGGYYVAIAADKILAHPAAITGSIGVIMLNISVEGLLQKIGVEDTSVKVGKYKDMGSPLKMMTEDERDIFQGVLNTFYERFLLVIKMNRKGLTHEDLVQIADGRIYTAQQALEYNLIDQIGYLDDGIMLAKKEAGIKKARVVMYRRPGSYKNNIYSQLKGFDISAITLFNFDLKTLARPGTPSFMYLWVPAGPDQF